MASSSVTRTTAPKPTTDAPTDAVAALRCLAAVCGQPRDTLLSDEESYYGMEVLLTMIADEVEGGAA